MGCYAVLIDTYRRFGTAFRIRNVGNYQSVLRYIAEEQRPHLHHGGSLKSRLGTPREISSIL